MFKERFQSVLNTRTSKSIFIGCCIGVLAAAACSSDSDENARIFREFICAIAAEDSNRFAIGGSMGFSAFSLDAGLSYTEDSPGNETEFTDADWNVGVSWYTARGGFLFNKLSLSGTYNNVDLGTTEDLKAVTWASPNVGLVVGNNGFMSRTEDSGSTWVNMSLGNSNFYAVDCANQNLCYASGSGGFFARTQDAGKNWTNIDIGFNYTGTLKGLYAEGNNVWLTGDSGFLAGSFDNGDSWNQFDAGTTRDLNDIRFIPGTTHGMVVGDEYVGRTMDAGLNWERVDRLIESAVIFKRIEKALNDNSLFLSGTNGVVLQTPDLGENFLRYPIVYGESAGGDFEDSNAVTPEEGNNFEDTGGSFEDTGGIVVEPEPQEPGTAAFTVSNENFEFSHDVGTTECPQKIGEFTLTNTGNVELAFVLTAQANAPMFADPSGGFTLNSGESRVISLFFDCSQTTSFNGTINIDGAGAGGVSAEANIQVQGNIN